MDFLSSCNLWEIINSNRHLASIPKMISFLDYRITAAEWRFHNYINDELSLSGQSRKESFQPGSARVVCLSCMSEYERTKAKRQNVLTKNDVLSVFQFNSLQVNSSSQTQRLKNNSGMLFLCLCKHSVDVCRCFCPFLSCLSSFLAVVDCFALV